MIDRKSRHTMERVFNDLYPTLPSLRFALWVGRVLDDPVGAICRFGDHSRRLAPFLEECGNLCHTMGRMADKLADFTDGFKETE